jgi:hypothetical protein
MIDPTKAKEVALSPVEEFAKTQFDLTTVAGRDAIAEQIETDIDEYCQKAYDDGPRSHLGASIIGHDCDFYLWAEFRWMKREVFNGRMLRLFNRGHWEESHFIEWLTGIGFEVKQVESDGKQIRFAACERHFGGSCDGNTALPTRYGNFPDKILLEFKTANDRLFGKVKNSGVVKEKTQHWGQACMYGYAMNIQYLLYICINKNTDEMDIELLELDRGIGEQLLQRAENIIKSETPPLRIMGHNMANFMCKYCAKNGICHMGEPIDRNCRSCAAAIPVANGEWHCRMWNNNIPKDFIPKGCDSWTPLNVL